MYFLLKTLISALVIAGVSELARRYSVLAALVASLPLTSILAFIWLYYDTRDVQKIMALSYDIFWLVIPSLLFFILFPLLLKTGMKFPFALVISCGCMAACYGVFITVKRIFL